MTNNYTCPKCGGNHYSTDQISTTGTGLSKIFDIQNRKFTIVTCNNCKYSEMYKAEVSELSNIFDLFIG